LTADQPADAASADKVNADKVIDGVRIATSIDGQRYTAKLTWGRR